MMLTRNDLVAVMPRAASVADQVTPALDAAMARYEIDTPARMAAFLAQLAHESGQLQRWNENLGYRWQRLRQVFPKYFKTDAEAQAFDRQHERIANRVYGGRLGNGPEDSGDGWRYRGRGPIQLTGKRQLPDVRRGDRRRPREPARAARNARGGLPCGGLVLVEEEASMPWRTPATSWRSRRKSTAA